MTKNNQFELILCIVNTGYTDLVMEAASKNGARGGTVLTARGSGNLEAEKLYGITITPEKEIVMIVVPKDIKDNVLKAIYEEAGLDTRGQGIAFSLPVDEAVGLNAGIEAEKHEN
jgi:nitrogen regulatory protein PII